MSLGLLPWEARRVVAELTAPEQDTFARLRREPERIRRHLDAVQMQWAISTLARILRYEVAQAYRDAKATNPGGETYVRLDRPNVQRLFDAAPGYDADLVKSARRASRRAKRRVSRR